MTIFFIARLTWALGAVWVTQMESAWEALESELGHELTELRLEEERMEVIKEQQMELLLQAAREREEVWL